MMIDLFLMALAIAAVSVTVTKSYIFQGMRKRVSRASKWLGKLVSCPYCFSHWVALVGVLCGYFEYRNVLVDVFVLVGATALIIGILKFLMETNNENTDSSVQHNRGSGGSAS